MSARPEPSDSPERALSEREARILEFERQWWQHAGAKDEAIRETFALSAARYYQLLNAVIDSPGAARQDPMLIGRLQRARAARANARQLRAFTSSAGGSPVRPLPSESND